MREETFPSNINEFVFLARPHGGRFVGWEEANIIGPIGPVPMFFIVNDKKQRKIAKEIKMNNCVLFFFVPLCNPRKKRMKEKPPKWWHRKKRKLISSGESEKTQSSRRRKGKEY